MPIPSFLLPDHRPATRARLLQMRATLGMTQREVAQMLDVDRQIYGAWERGRHPMPRAAWQCLVLKYNWFLERAEKLAKRERRRLREEEQHMKPVRNRDEQQWEPNYT